MSDFYSWSFVDAEDINALHDDALVRYGGMPGIRDSGCPDAKIAATKNAVMYSLVDEDDQPDLLLAAAHLIVYFTTGHCYTDGNKRAAWLAALRLLDLNGIRLRGDDPEAATLIERVAQKKATVADVVAWLGRPERLYEAPIVVEIPELTRGSADRGLFGQTVVELSQQVSGE